MFFQVDKDCWYGGGCDLTPAYFFEDDAKEFHQFWNDVCEAHQPGSYARFKSWCDEYFYIPARKEHRGVGGIFFDDQTREEFDNIEQVYPKPLSVLFWYMAPFSSF